MRLLFLLLLLANVGYIAWELNQPRPQARQVPLQDPGVKKLVLLSELPHTEKPRPQKKAEVPVHVATANSPKTQNEAKAHAESKPEKTAETAAAGKANTPAPKKPAQPVFACYTLGPFRDLADLRKLTRRMHKYVAEASYRSHEEREQSMYWVYLPKQKSHKAANAIGDLLKQKHIRDFYVVPKGEQANAISLGHFKEVKGALKVQKRVEAAGFPAQIQPVFKNYTIYWLDYRVRSDHEIPASVLDLSRLPNVSRLDRNCK